MSNSLEEKLLHNALDSVVHNIDRYEAPALVHLLDEVMRKRPDLARPLHRLFSSYFTPEVLLSIDVQPAAPGQASMAGTSDELMDYLTLPKMHRTQLRILQQLQEKLMPAGYLISPSKDFDMGDMARLAGHATSQLSKVLGLTKAVRAQAEVARLREAIGKGLEEVGKGTDKETQAQALTLFQEGMRRHLTGTKDKLQQTLEEAERLGG